MPIFFSAVLLRAAVVVLFAAGLAPACTWWRTPAQSANSVIAWDVNAQAAISASEAAYVTDNGFAMVSAAVYDAVNAIAKTPYEPYLVAPPATGSESVDAAVATAAFDVLVSLYPRQRASLQPKYDQALRAVPNGAAKDGGRTVGAAAAAAMIAARTNDGRYASIQWVNGTEPGQWRPTPPIGGGRRRLARRHEAVRHPEPGPLPHGRSAGADQPRVHRRLQRGEGRRFGDEHDPHRGSGHGGPLVERRTAHRLGDQAPAGDEPAPERRSTPPACSPWATWPAPTGTIACSTRRGSGASGAPSPRSARRRTTATPTPHPDPNWSPLLGMTPPFPDYPSGHTSATVANMVVNQFFFGR